MEDGVNFKNLLATSLVESFEHKTNKQSFCRDQRTINWCLPGTNHFLGYCFEDNRLCITLNSMWLSTSCILPSVCFMSKGIENFINRCFLPLIYFDSRYDTCAKSWQVIFMWFNLKRYGAELNAPCVWVNDKVDCWITWERQRRLFLHISFPTEINVG